MPDRTIEEWASPLPPWKQRDGDSPRVQAARRQMGWCAARNGQVHDRLSCSAVGCRCGQRLAAAEGLGPIVWWRFAAILLAAAAFFGYWYWTAL